MEFACSSRTYVDFVWLPPTVKKIGDSKFTVGMNVVVCLFFALGVKEIFISMGLTWLIKA